MDVWKAGTSILISPGALKHCCAQKQEREVHHWGPQTLLLWELLPGNVTPKAPGRPGDKRQQDAHSAWHFRSPTAETSNDWFTSCCDYIFLTTQAVSLHGACVHVHVSRRVCLSVRVLTISCALLQPNLDPDHPRQKDGRTNMPSERKATSAIPVLETSKSAGQHEGIISLQQLFS